MSKLSALLVLCALVAVQFTAQSASVDNTLQGDPPQRTYAFNFGGGLIVGNDCCDETVLITGRGVILFDADGLKHLTIHHASGVSIDDDWNETGNTYAGRGAAALSVNETGNGSWMVTLTTRMISTNGCSFTLRVNIHVTMDANGAVRSEVTTFDVICE